MGIPFQKEEEKQNKDKMGERGTRGGDSQSLPTELSKVGDEGCSRLVLSTEAGSDYGAGGESY